jgi:glycosyltransferase involved in cell wall biosynthesis
MLRQIHPSLNLVFVGKQDGVFKSTNSRIPASQILRLDYVEDGELAALMSGAELFVYPSEYEGFGLCALEAMACGTPVFISTAGGLIESVGDCGYSVDIKNLHQFVSSLDFLLSNPEKRDVLRANGIKRVEDFGWDRTTRIVESTLNSI